MHQKKWRSVLKEIVFALNTTVSAATKCVPYSVVHGRDAVIPEDVTLGRAKAQLGQDVASPTEFAVETRLRLDRAYETINKNLSMYRSRMEKSYNSSTKLHEYSVGDEVWLRKKTFKCGESEKLAPRRTGPWTVVEVKANGRNFLIRSRNGKRYVVHHDRLTPLARNDNDNDVNEPPVVVAADSESSDEYETATGGESPESESDDSDGGVVAENVRRYPLRTRTQREIPGAVRFNPNSSSSSTDDGEGE